MDLVYDLRLQIREKLTRTSDRQIYSPNCNAEQHISVRAYCSSFVLYQFCVFKILSLTHFLLLF